MCPRAQARAAVLLSWSLGPLEEFRHHGEKPDGTSMGGSRYET